MDTGFRFHKALVVPLLAAGLTLVSATSLDQIRIRVEVDGQVIEEGVRARGVTEALRELGVSLAPEDDVFPARFARLYDGDAVRVRRGAEIQAVSLFLPRTHSFAAPPLARSAPKPAPAARRILRGRDPGPIPEGRTPPTEAKSILTVVATAYTPGPESCGKSADGITATGHRAGPGIIAVDPRVIPLGTRLFVEGYGYGRALDVGGAIKGNRVDVCYNSVPQARRWGRRTVRVYLLD